LVGQEFSLVAMRAAKILEEGARIPAKVIQRRPPANLIAEDRRLFEDQYSYSTFDSGVKYVGNAKVSADSVVYKNYAPIPETLYREDLLSYYRVRYLAKKILKARKVQVDSGTNFLLATDQESQGHFHWFTEVVPRLWLTREIAGEFVLMLPDTPYVRTIGISSLEHIGFRFADILWMKAEEFYDVPSLYIVTKVSRTGQMHDGIMHELNRAFIGNAAGGTKRLYIGRDHAHFRKVLNRRELIQTLKAHDVEVIHPMYMSFKEQINAFSECQTLIGIHGAGLTNCLFMPPGGKVVELRKREPNYGYWHLAGSLGHEYYYYHGVPDSDLSLVGRGCNLTVPIDDFERKILEHLE